MMQDQQTANPSWIRTGLIAIGGAGLLLAMFTDTIAVTGRHLGLPLVGAIEIVRASACVAACCAIVLATAMKNHASVHFLTDRMPKRYSDICARLSGAVSTLFFVALFVASSWLFLETLPTFEQTEVIGIPYPPLRFLASASALLSAIFFAVQAVRRSK